MHERDNAKFKIVLPQYLLQSYSITGHFYLVLMYFSESLLDFRSLKIVLLRLLKTRFNLKSSIV